VTNKLSTKEEDLLHRVEENVDFRPIFFRKVKGLKWFDALEERGYFSPDSNPKPAPAKEEGYVNIPSWPIIDYLVKTAPELSDQKNLGYAEKYLKLLVDVTNYAKENAYSNYRTWWQFAEIINYLPYEIVDPGFMDIIDYWLEDKYERGLIAQEIGEKWLPKLLELNNEHSLLLSKNLLEILYKVIFVDRKVLESSRRESSLRFDYYHAKKITEKIASLSGEKMGKTAIQVFDRQLIKILDEINCDLWSSVWQPAIEPHEQNKYREDAENVLVQAYRDSLASYIGKNPEEASGYVNEMLQADYQTIHRLAIHAISENYNVFRDKVDELLSEKYFESNFRHEMWSFLNRNYQGFTETQKDRTLGIISGIKREDDEGKPHEGATSYGRAIWLAAIKGHGNAEARLYEENVEIAKTEPEHPDFSSYMSSVWSGRKSPIPLNDLQALSIDELIQELENYKDPGGFDTPGLEGLVKTFKQLINTEPLKFYLHLGKFVNLDLAYIYEIIEAYRDLWTEKAQLPWDDIWHELLKFCSLVIMQDRFWDPENMNQRKNFVANRHWIVGSIGRLLEAGTKSDEHAFNEKYLKKVEEILAYLLSKVEGSEFGIDSDAVSISINSPRGHCIEALINMTLRSCRLSDKNNNKDHSEIWMYFQHYFDAELERADSENPEYEFVTLVTNYLPNFLYMSKEWVLGNLARIFDQDRYLKWLCAMQGYAYVGTIYQEIYQYLKEHGDLLKVLDDENIKDRVEEKVIQNISIAYINDFESFADDNSLINTLIARNDFDEISHFIWFIWTLNKRDDESLTEKVYELWKKILQNIDFSSRDGQRLASQLCQWSVFVGKDNRGLDLLLAVAPYSVELHHSHQLLESIAEISQAQPFDAHAIWMKMLETSVPDYPEKAIRQLFENLLKKGHEGLRKAREAESEYLKKGNDRPSLWLREIRQEIENV